MGDEKEGGREQWGSRADGLSLQGGGSWQEQEQREDGEVTWEE